LEHCRHEAATAYEMPVAQRLIDELLAILQVRIHGITKASQSFERVPTVSSTHANHKPANRAKALAALGINVWSGNNYAIEVLRHLRMDEREDVLRIGLAHYNTAEKLERTMAALNEPLG
jgi:selenocysteine lyase/cysteine desulfurase